MHVVSGEQCTMNINNDAQNGNQTQNNNGDTVSNDTTRVPNNNPLIPGLTNAVSAVMGAVQGGGEHTYRNTTRQDSTASSAEMCWSDVDESNYYYDGGEGLAWPELATVDDNRNVYVPPSPLPHVNIPTDRPTNVPNETNV